MKLSYKNKRSNSSLYQYKWLVFALTLFTSFQSFSQIKLVRHQNSSLKYYSLTHPEWNSNKPLTKWGRKDTLKIPFFDDFVTTKVYPDSMKWFNNTVYINNDFPINPPSYGVATLDDLNSKGQPYQELNDQTFGACDTFLSLPINLKDSSGRLYTPSDSIYFSFYFQRQGNGDASDSRDSLILQFKDNTGNFVTVFKAAGGAVQPFKLVMLKVVNTKFYHKGFQFRFINFARHTGNTNQWHLDYIHLARNRKSVNNFYDDFAIQTRPTSLLKNLFAMPYSHFISDSANQKAKLIFMNASNLSNSLKVIRAKHTESNLGTILVQTKFDANNANIPAASNAVRQFGGFNLNNLGGNPIVVKRDYQLEEENIGSKNVANDKITVYQEFGSYYAQDDGSAEMGFGFNDDEFHPEFTGAIAYKFNLVKSDSLWAIGMFFNRSVKSSADLQFDLKVWQNITPVAKGRGQDVSILTVKGLTPKFTDSLNGYHVFILDSAVLLPKGEFFIGWEQEGNAHLDVGFDINNGYHPGVESGDNLFFTLLGSWAEAKVKGALMMRPYVGKKIPLGPAGIKSVKSLEITCYPNPFTNVINIKSNASIETINIYNLSGQLIHQSQQLQIDTSFMEPGLYSIEIIGKNGDISHQKMVKLQY